MIVKIVWRNRIQADGETEFGETLQISLELRETTGSRRRVGSLISNLTRFIKVESCGGAMRVREQSRRNTRDEIVKIDEAELRKPAKSVHKGLVPHAR